MHYKMQVEISETVNAALLLTLKPLWKTPHDLQKKLLYKYHCLVVLFSDVI